MGEESGFDQLPFFEFLQQSRAFSANLLDQFSSDTTFFSYAQEKESTDVHKTRSSAIINGQKYYLHTVEKGQTLFAIAKFYQRDVNDIVIDNPEAIDGIKPGQILKIHINKKNPSELFVNDSINFTPPYPFNTASQSYFLSPSIGNDAADGRVRLGGGTHSRFRMRLRIIFSRI